MPAIMSWRIVALAAFIFGSSIWVLTAWLSLAVIGWGIADSGRGLTPTEWALLLLVTVLPTGTLGLLGVCAWTGRLPRKMDLLLPTVIAAASCAYVVWALEN